MTVTRRQFLGGAIALTAGQLTTGCTFWQRPSLRVQVLDGTLPVQLLKLFRQQHRGQGKFKFVPVPSSGEGFTVLQYWRGGRNAYQRGPIKLPWGGGQQPVDVITLGDAWLTGAIRQELIQPLDASAWSEWENLPLAWRSLVQRNAAGLLDSQGPVWAAPYRGGSTVIAYRKDRLEALGVDIQDWEDLWNEKLKGHISLLNDPREVIGLTLKSLGASYNTADLSAVAELKPKLAALDGQAKFYSSNHYLEPLLLEDTWVAVGWSGDLLPLLQRDRHLALVYPKSGTALWAELWVQPRGTQPAEAPAKTALLNDWINFCWTPKVAQLISTFSDGFSPRALDRAGDWRQSLLQPEILLPEGERLARSEFIEPLPQASLDQYQALWDSRA